MSNTVKLKDIAEKLGISVVTVSNALSSKKGVSERLRHQVRSVADELNYDMSKYEGNKTGGVKIGVIIPENYLAVGASFYWSMYQHVAFYASKRHSYTMFEIISSDNRSKRELPNVIKDQSIDGLIVIGCVETKYIKNILDITDIPVVLLDFYDESLKCDAVMSNNYMGMYKATRYLLERGHKKIAFVGSRMANDNIMDRFFGYRKAIEEWGITLRKDWIIEDRNPDNSMLSLKLPKEMPTAFACNSDLSASCIYDELLRHGYRVPEDISIVGYDNYLYQHEFANKITTYNVDMELMARKAVSKLIKKIGKQSKSYGVSYIDSVIIERTSVRAI